MVKNAFRLFLAAAAALGLAACGGDDTLAGGGGDPGLIDNPVAAAIASSDRPPADRRDDALRRPADVLAFAGVEPGMTVFEMEAVSGYYTELLSRIVGPEGEVVMQNPAAFDSFAGDDIARRLEGNRLPNVRQAKCNFDDLKAVDASADIVTWFLGPHELWFMPPGVESLGDPEGAFAEAYRVLKPGGRFVVLDHAAPAGTPTSSGNILHRIDPQVIKDLAAGAGFEFVEESDLLRNPDDDFALAVFDPSVRRKTDRVLLKYRKPE